MNWLERLAQEVFVEWEAEITTTLAGAVAGALLILVIVQVWLWTR